MSARVLLSTRSRCRRWIACVASALLLACAQGAAAAAEIRIEPSDGLIDAPLAIEVRGLTPGAEMDLAATEVDARGRRWQSRATFRASAQGVIDTARLAPHRGAYSGVDPGGLLWSMAPADVADPRDYWPQLSDRSRAISRPVPATPLGPRQGEVLVSGPDGSVLARAAWTRRRIGEGVTRTEVAAGRVRGVWFAPAKPSASRSVAVIVLGGSFGGLKLDYPALLASHGFPSLALAFFKYADLPDTGDEIALEYFAEALQWTRKQSGVDKVVLLGHSRGAEAVLLTASAFPTLADGVIALAPSPAVNNGEGKAWGDWLWTQKSMWALGGVGVPFAPYVVSQTDAVRAYRDDSRRSLPGYGTGGEYRSIWLDPDNARYAIAVERTRAPLLLVGGTADAMWPADLAVQRLAVKAPDAQALLLPGAGHALGIPGEVTTYGSAVWVEQAFEGWAALGGDAAADARGSTELWRAILEFLAQVSRDKSFQ